MRRSKKTRWVSFFAFAVVFSLLQLSCRKEVSQEPVSDGKSETAEGSSAEKTTDGIADTGSGEDENITGAALQDTGMQQELEDPVEVPPAPSQMGQNLKGWKPAKNKKAKAKTVAGSRSFPKDMWVIADSLTIRSGPGAGFARTGNLTYGAKVTVLAVDQRFARLGEKQFVALRYLTDRKAKFIPAKK